MAPREGTDAPVIILLFIALAIGMFVYYSARSAQEQQAIANNRAAFAAGTASPCASCGGIGFLYSSSDRERFNIDTGMRWIETVTKSYRCSICNGTGRVPGVQGPGEVR